MVRAAFGRKDKDDKQSDSGDLITNLVGAVSTESSGTVGIATRLLRPNTPPDTASRRASRLSALVKTVGVGLGRWAGCSRA